MHVLLRYRWKTTKMQKFPIDSHSNKNFIAPFFCPQGTLTTTRGEDTSGTRVRTHANFDVNRPSGWREIVDRTKKTYSKTNTSPFALSSEWRVIIIISKFMKCHVCLHKAAEALVRCRSDGLVTAIKQECLKMSFKTMFRIAQHDFCRQTVPNDRCGVR